MTQEELVEEIRATFLRSEATYLEDEEDPRPARVVFYLSALRGIKNAPHSVPTLQNEILKFLDAKLKEALDDLPMEDTEKTMQLFEEMMRLVGTSIYSFGEDSPLKFHIPDKMAMFYNAAADEFFKAQQRFNQKHGREWDPTLDPIKLNWSKKQKKAWNEFAKIFKREVERQGPFHENDIMDDFLVKNAAGVITKAPKKAGRVIMLAVAGGVLYGFLNSRKTHV